MRTSIALLLIFSATSCLPKFSETGLRFSTKTGLTQRVEAPTFEAISKSAKCSECHAKTYADPARMDRWMAGTTPRETKLFKSVESGSMPKNGTPLTTGELEVFEKYISNYQVRTKILEPKCLQCHSKTLNDTERFSKWIVPGKPEESRLYLSVKSGKMPKNGTPLTATELSVIENYILNLR